MVETVSLAPVASAAGVVGLESLIIRNGSLCAGISREAAVVDWSSGTGSKQVAQEIFNSAAITYPKSMGKEGF